MILRHEEMPALVGQACTIIERPHYYKYGQEITAAFQRCWVQLIGNEDFEYCVRLGDLLYENSEVEAPS